MEGRNHFDNSSEPREYIISTRDRCDFTIDRIRSITTKKYKYIRNFMTDRPYTQLTYMDVNGVEFVQVMKQLYNDNKLDSVQARFFLDERPEEELYDLIEDPYEVNNLAANPEYVTILNKYQKILNDWIRETNDKGQFPENEEGLKFMLGIWGKNAINVEYDPLREKFKDLEGSLIELKTQKRKFIEN